MKKIESKLGKEVCTLAYGEVTGHSHSIFGGTAQLFETNDKDINKLIVDSYSSLTHEDHATIILPQKEELEVFIQEEYDPELEWRKTQD